VLSTTTAQIVRFSIFDAALWRSRYPQSELPLDRERPLPRSSLIADIDARGQRPLLAQTVDRGVLEVEANPAGASALAAQSPLRHQVSLAPDDTDEALAEMTTRSIGVTLLIA
jgi:hypothetical protein